ncbi:hypothetical protein BN961_03267 [Afipia felis]|uniref:Uncharacterized protein n=1 Tax=Afipia felis TaxID=1035 RepID=A0A090MR46_AFIFE|nr:hypothetical protein BN961_03267 [Afipia felis]
MSCSNSGVERAHGRPLLSRWHYAVSKLCHPVVLSESGSAAVEEWLDSTCRSSDLGKCPGHARRKGSEHAGRGMDEHNDGIRKNKPIGMNIQIGAPRKFGKPISDLD